MPTRLIQVVQFVNVPAAGVVALPHNININDVQKRPDYVASDQAGFTVAVTATTVTVTNNNSAPLTVNVWLELKHTIPRQLGNKLLNLSPQPFVASGGGVAGGSTSTGVFVWEAGMAWDTVYATVNDGRPWIVLVEVEAPARVITTGAGTNLWNLYFMSLGHFDHYQVPLIRTTAGFTLGLDPNGFARLQSKNIQWEFITGGTPIASGVSVAVDIDGGQLGHTTGDCFVTDQFVCSVYNNGAIIGIGGSALVRLTGDLSVVTAATWAQIRQLCFRTTTGPKTLTVDIDWTIREVNGTAFGAGVTPSFPQNQAHAVSPDGTFWTLEVDNTGTLIIS